MQVCLTGLKHFLLFALKDFYFDILKRWIRKKYFFQKSSRIEVPGSKKQKKIVLFVCVMKFSDIQNNGSRDIDETEN